MNTRLHRIAAGLITVTLAGAGLPALALGSCAAPARAEARQAAYSPQGLFDRGGAELSSSGRQRLTALARSLNGVEVEAVIVIVAAPAGAVAEPVREAAQQRAEAVRRQLLRQGVAADRVYLEQRRTGAADTVLDEPLLIETIAAWRLQGGSEPGSACLGANIERTPRGVMSPG